MKKGHQQVKACHFHRRVKQRWFTKFESKHQHAVQSDATFEAEQLFI